MRVIVFGVNFFVKIGCTPNCKASNDMYTQESDADGDNCNRVFVCLARRRPGQVRVLIAMDDGGANSWEGPRRLIGVVRTDSNGENDVTDE